MKTSRYTAAQIFGILREAEGGMPVAELCRAHGMSSASFYKWRVKYGGMDASLISQMKAMEDENRRLKRMYADLSMQTSACRPTCSRRLLEKMTRPSQRREMAGNAVARHEVDFSLPAERVIRSLDRIIEWRGKPGAIRVDNGPEYIIGKLLEWAAKQGVILKHIQPGQPQQNAYIERYNRTVRHEWLDQYIIEAIEEAQDFATQWLWTYNNDRPNIGIGGITPAMKLKMIE